jgi:hypothetical protein
MLTDTPPDVQRAQIELARRSTTAEKIAQVRRMTDSVVRLSRRAIARANPEFSAEEVDLRWVEIRYGPELGTELRKYLKNRR